MDIKAANKSYYANLQEYLLELESNGKLVRVTEAINRIRRCIP